jgi:uncharacterized protein (DUF1778 family)
MTRADVEWPERRSSRLHVRVEPHIKNQIEEAAKETSMTVSDFVISAVRERARQVLARRTNTVTESLDEYMAGLSESQTEALDRMAADKGLSRADLIRRLLDRALSGADDDLEADLAAIDASFGAYRDIQVVTRGEDERAEHLASMWQDTQ